jgi:hypothetical protein
MSGWTSAADLRAEVQRLWEKGRLLAGLVDAESPFPLRLVLKAPSSRELSDRFDEARHWSRSLQQEAEGCRLLMREFRHPVLGHNAVPAQAWVDSLDDALQLIGKRRDAQRFAALVAATRARLPALLPWLQTHPLRALSLQEHWPRLMDIVAWLQAHPRPGIYLRQLDLPDVHSKYVEEHAAVLCELFDLALPPQVIDTSNRGAANLARRYGFRTKPVRVRLRVLDPARALLNLGADEDITLDHASFARLAPDVSRVFITENEVNFLAFPLMADALVVFGAGYGFDALAEAGWLHERALCYWGDIDTHGFAILDQLRGHFAQVESFLMDHETLMAHRSQWTREPQPVLRELPNLRPAERALFDDLRWLRLEDGHVRLEQERIGFCWVEQALGGFGPLIDRG